MRQRTGNENIRRGKAASEMGSEYRGGRLPCRDLLESI